MHAFSHTLRFARSPKRQALLSACSVLFLISTTSSAFAAPPSLSSKLAACATHATTSNVSPDTWMDGDPSADGIIIDFHDDVTIDEAKAFGRTWGLDLRLNSPLAESAKVFIATVPEGAVPAYATCMGQDPRIEGIEENLRMRAFSIPTETATNTPDDPLYPFQWNFSQIGVESAWAQSTGEGVTVAVIDTGVALENDPSRNIKAVPDLAGTKQVPGYDFVDSGEFAWDGHGHGTHVAGTIAQTTNNSYGVAGIAYNAAIMPLRVLNSDGYGGVADIADAIRFAADNGAHVINMSLGGPLPSLVMSRAIQYAYKKGVTIVAAAGNSGRREESYPAAYKNVIAVAATQFDRSTTFYSQWGSFVDIAAPGGNTRVDQNGDGRPDGIMQETLQEGQTDKHEFALYMGTSMASPHVAGVAALIISEGITNPKKVEEILLSSASKSEESRFSNKKEYHERYGAGIVQADQAVQMATTSHGSWRLAIALLLSLFAFGSRRRSSLRTTTRLPSPLFFATLILFSSGLFFLPPLLHSLGATHLPLISFLSAPFSQWELIALGPDFHQNPLTVSFLVPLTAVALLGTRSDNRRNIVAAISLGIAATCFVDSFFLLSDIRWIPGTGLLDRTFLIINAGFSLAIGLLALRDK